jgi:hypothetical protein
MRITDALKPVTDALATAGMSLESATYKDGKIHATLSTEAPKATGKPGSGPEFPPEGYRLLVRMHGAFPHVGADIPSMAFHKVFLRGFGWRACDERLQILDAFKGAEVLAIAVPIAPKPEPVKLTDQEKIVGWRGPTGFRLQTFQNREVQCAVCKKTIKAGERLARWRSKFPEVGDQDHVVGHPGNEENHSHAHVDCLYRKRKPDSRLFRSGGLDKGMFVLHLMKHGISFHMEDVPKWLQEKRAKYDAQQSTP